MMLSRVLLPQPDGPMTETNSPAPTSRSMSVSATVSMRSVRYTFSIAFEPDRSRRGGQSHRRAPRRSRWRPTARRSQSGMALVIESSLPSARM